MNGGAGTSITGWVRRKTYGSGRGDVVDRDINLQKTEGGEESQWAAITGKDGKQGTKEALATSEKKNPLVEEGMRYRNQDASPAGKKKKGSRRESQAAGGGGRLNERQKPLIHNTR